jgi:UDP-3-O-[3-hydroxymyristoyl] glucosamine N-acyltransferase
MTQNHFYEKKGPYPLNEIAKHITCENAFDNKNSIEIYGFESLTKASPKDITFLNSIKYKDFSINTKAIACITTTNLSKFLAI